jgi:hypothetical protein
MATARRVGFLTPGHERAAEKILTCDPALYPLEEDAVHQQREQDGDHVHHEADFPCGEPAYVEIE